MLELLTTPEEVKELLKTSLCMCVNKEGLFFKKANKSRKVINYPRSFQN
jgi:hypothetical protein